MILIVGATGNLGHHVARQLLAHGHQVRAMTRNPTRAVALAAAGAEVVQGDLRDPASVRTATRGTHTVVSASHAMLGAGANSSTKVDDAGQRTLIAAAKDAGVSHVVFTSVLGASIHHPVDFWRTKARIEQLVEGSGIAYTIVRPSAFMEIHAYELIGKAVATGRRVMLFGPGTHPKNFVAAADVATLIAHAIMNDALRNATVEIGGPENLTSRQVVETFERVTGKTATVTSLPLPVLRVMSHLLAPVHGGVSRILTSAIVGETTDQRFDPAPLLARIPLRLTRLEDWARLLLA